MEFIINTVPFSSVHEEERLREVLEKIIKEEDLPRYKAFTNEPPSKKRKRLQKVNNNYNSIYLFCRSLYFFYIF